MQESYLKEVIKEPILQSNPSAQIALFLLFELRRKDSFWTPYLTSLPRTYTTPLYWSLDDILALKGSALQAVSAKTA